MATPERDAVRDAQLTLKAGAARLLLRVPAWPGVPVDVSVDDGEGLELLVALRRKAGAASAPPVDHRRLLDFFLSPLGRLVVVTLHGRGPLKQVALAGLCGQLDAKREAKPGFRHLLAELQERGILDVGDDGYVITNDFRPLLPAVLGTADAT
jgi:hypothetical protein